VTIIDVLVDYSRNTELFAELHDGVWNDVYALKSKYNPVKV
jgi:hypothetical protein